ncbi:retrovirus-related pol polyprotein from transposon TNT 1-94 [Tanacetum coccineum]|uniref:Retrovirus-related pol polyprotein from transposon TNT 1-94 n=1 Tax=Tanacetum coccineum TaxID=301880 RepID=A0ABQ5HZ16_9ASTR
MHSGKKLSEHIEEFNKLIGDLANIDVDINDEDRALMLLTSLSSSYDNFVETLLYGRESLTLEDVLSSLNSWELKKRTNAKDYGDGLYVKGRSDHQDCLKLNKKKSTGFVKKNVGHGFGMHCDGYDNDDLLMAVSEERFLEWIMDYGGSCYMTSRRDFLFDFKEFDGGTVLLGDNRACVIRGIVKVRVQMKDGSSFVLENVRYIPELKRNLISLGTLDREGYTVKLVLVYNKGKVLHRCGINAWGHISEAGLHELEKRDVLGNKGLVWFPDSFWAEATVTATYLINRSPSTALEKKTPMDLRSGHLANYEMLRIFGCVAYSHMNQGKLKPRAIKCIFLGYPNDSGKKVEFEVELQGSRVEPTMDTHNRENTGNEDKEQDEGPQQQNLHNYVLEAINSSEKDEWVRVMKEEISSLKKNHTWELVDQPPGQKLLSCKWLYKIKEGIKGVQKPRYKARLVAVARRETFILGNPHLFESNGKQGMYVERKTLHGLISPTKAVSVSLQLGAHFKVSLKDCPSSDWDVERTSKAPYVNVVGLVYGRDQGKHMDFDGFVDVDYAKDPDKGRSITGEIVKSKAIEVEKIGTEDNADDAFRKVVPGLKFKYCMEILGVGIN